MSASASPGNVVIGQGPGGRAGGSCRSRRCDRPAPARRSVARRPFCGQQGAQAGFLEASSAGRDRGNAHMAATTWGARRSAPSIRRVGPVAHAPALPARVRDRADLVGAQLAAPSSRFQAHARATRRSRRNRAAILVSANGPSMTSGGSRSRSVVAAVVGRRAATRPGRQPSLARLLQERGGLGGALAGRVL